MKDELKPVFSGPPPSMANRGRVRSRLDPIREAAKGKPGEWCHVDAPYVGAAGSWANILRKQGFEATTRGKTLYARWPEGGE